MRGHRGAARVAQAALVVVGLAVGVVAPAGAIAGDPAWSQTYNGALITSQDEPTAMVVSPAGSTVFVTGHALSGSNTDMVTTAYNASTGAIRWSKRYDGAVHGDDYPGAISVTPDGSKVIVTASSPGSSLLTDQLTIAYAAGTGAVLWTRRRSAAAYGVARPLAMAVSADGTRVSIVGSLYQARGISDYVTVTYATATGASVWERRFDGGRDDVATGVAFSPGGTRVFVTGRSEASAYSFDVVTYAYSAATGSTIWSRRYDTADHQSDAPADIGITKDGAHLFVTGVAAGRTPLGYATADLLTLSLSTVSGSVQWVRRYDGPAHLYDEARALTVAPDGSKVYVTGFSGGTTTQSDAVTFAYGASNGSTIWGTRFDGASHQSDDGVDLAVSPSGATVFMTGQSYGATTGADWVVLAYRGSTGAKLWGRRHDQSYGNDEPVAIRVSPLSTHVFVTGSVDSWNAMDIGTVAYRTS